MSKKITLKCSPASYHCSGLLQGGSCGLPTFGASVPAAHLLVQIQIRSSVELCWLRREWDQDWILRQLGQFQGCICRTWNIQSQPVQGWLFCWHISGPKAERQTRGSHSQEAPTEEDKSRQLLWTQTVQFQATDSFAKKQLKKDGSFRECEINFTHSVKVMLSVYQKVSLKKMQNLNLKIPQWGSDNHSNICGILLLASHIWMQWNLNKNRAETTLQTFYHW